MRASSVLLAAGASLVLFGCQLDVSLRHLPREQPIVVQATSVGGDVAAGMPVDSQILVAGGRIFDERCSPCHGHTGHGDGPLAEVLPIAPRNYHDEPFKWGSKPSDIVRTIQEGRSEVMPPFAGELTPREIWAVAYVVWSWIPEDRREYDGAASFDDH